jgi:hypothetical protein
MIIIIIIVLNIGKFTRRKKIGSTFIKAPPNDKPIFSGSGSLKLSRSTSLSSLLARIERSNTMNTYIPDTPPVRMNIFNYFFKFFCFFVKYIGISFSY